MKYKKFQVVEIEWEDNLSADDERWQFLDELPKNPKPSRVKAIGYVVQANNKGVAIVTRVSESVDDEPQVRGYSYIAQSSIKKIRIITP